MVVPYGELKDSITQKLEHVKVGTVDAKRVLLAGYDGVNINDAYVDSSGNLKVDVDMATEGIATEATLAKLPGLSIPIHDEIVLSYTGDNLTGVVYKLATATVATLTLSYTGSNLIGVVKT